MESGLTDYFEIATAMRQGCILSPFLFLLPMDFTMEKKQWMTKAVASSGKEELDFGDDISLLANTRADLQSMTTNLEREAAKIGLRLNSERVKVMITAEATMFPPITIDHQTTEEVKHFTHLSSVGDNNGEVEAYVNSRIGKASSTFPRLCHDLVNVNN